MGIKQLSKLIAELAPNAVTVERVNDWKGKKVAIDVSNYLYQFSYRPESKKPNYHVAGFFQLVYELAKESILPVMIMDGKPCDAKDYILEQRHTEREKKKEKIATLQETVNDLEKKVTDDNSVATELRKGQEQVKRLDRQIINVSEQMWNDILELFRLLGVPVLQATHEADLLASRLCQMGLVDAVISEDLDHLTFGAPCLIRDFNNKREPDCRVYRLQDILSSLDLTHDQFIDVCILCGCDYTAKIDGIAWKRAYQLIKEKENIEAIILAIENNEKKFNKFKIPEEFNYKAARAIFNSQEELLLCNDKFNSQEELFRKDDKFNSQEELLEDLNPTELLISELKPFLMEKCKYRESTLDPKFKTITLFYKTLG